MTPLATDTLLTLAAWIDTGTYLFGSNMLDWRFMCPSCGHVQTPRQFQALGADVDLAYFNCIGRHDGVHNAVDIGTKPGPCNYTGGGLFKLSPVMVLDPITEKTQRVFAFDSNIQD